MLSAVLAAHDYSSERSVSPLAFMNLTVTDFSESQLIMSKAIMQQ